MGRWWRTPNLPTPKGHFVLKCFSFVLLNMVQAQKMLTKLKLIARSGGSAYWQGGLDSRAQLIGKSLGCTCNICTCPWVLTICRHPEHFAKATPRLSTWCYTYIGLKFVAKTILVLYLITPIRNTAIWTTAWSPKDQQWSSHHFLLLLRGVSGTE